MSEIKLKPCPFCGVEAEVLDAYGGYSVKCRSCFCGTGIYKDSERASEAWNRRIGEQVNRMSDDLISRKTLKRAIDHDFYEHYTKYHDTDQRALIDMVMDDIDEMPTAFDKEKVIKDLEKHKKLAEIIYHNDSTERHFGESIAYQKVIDMIHKCKSSIRSQTMKLSNLNRGNR